MDKLHLLYPLSGRRHDAQDLSDARNFAVTGILRVIPWGMIDIQILCAPRQKAVTLTSTERQLRMAYIEWSVIAAPETALGLVKALVNSFDGASDRLQCGKYGWASCMRISLFRLVHPRAPALTDSNISVVIAVARTALVFHGTSFVNALIIQACLPLEGYRCRMLHFEGEALRNLAYHNAVLLIWGRTMRSVIELCLIYVADSTSRNIDLRVLTHSTSYQRPLASNGNGYSKSMHTNECTFTD